MPKTKKPLSEARLTANRANAKKSTGPKTPEGKATSALNSGRHRLLATCNTLGFESDTFYLAIQKSIEDTFQPKNEAEQAALDEYTLLNWNLSRTRAAQTRLLDDACKPGTRIDDAITLVAEGFKNLHGEDAYFLIGRYESRLSRMKARALDEFLKIRAFTEKYPPAHTNTIVDPAVIFPSLQAPAAAPPAVSPETPQNLAFARRSPREQTNPNSAPTNSRGASITEIFRTAAAALFLFCLLFLTTQSAQAENPIHTPKKTSNFITNQALTPPDKTETLHLSATSRRVSHGRDNALERAPQYKPTN